MADAWIYIDESQGPHRSGGAPFWVASLLTDAPIGRELVDGAMAHLRADPEAVGNKHDGVTLERGFFHGSEDSKNGHSWFCRAIAGCVKANFLATQWFFDDDEEGFEGARLHQLAIALSVVPAFQDDFDCLHVVIAPRAGSFVDADLQQWLGFVREAQLRVVFDMPNLSARFPAVDGRLGEPSEAGLQVVDFLLWAVQRANPDKLAPTGDSTWLERVGLQIWAQARAQGSPPGQIMGKLGRGVARSVPTAPSVIGPPQVSALTGEQRWRLVSEMAADIHRAAAALPTTPRISHLGTEITHASQLCDLVRKLRGDERLPKAFADIMTSFLLICDTWPAFDRSSLAAWTRAAEKRAVAADYLSKNGQIWLPTNLDLGATATSETVPGGSV